MLILRLLPIQAACDSQQHGYHAWMMTMAGPASDTATRLLNGWSLSPGLNTFFLLTLERVS